MPEPKPTKKQRLEEAREAARLAREKREKRQRMVKILTPVLASVVIVVVVVAIVAVIALQPKATAAGSAPKNMATFGLQYQAKDGKMTALRTPAQKSSKGPADSTVATTSAKYHIVEYVDLSCPVCKEFESQTAAYTEQLVESGQATLEFKPIAILDRLYNGTNYSTRINTAGACVANFEPQNFRAFALEAYSQQPDEESDGLTNAQIVSLAHKAGVNDKSIDACITNQNYSAWVDAVTQDALSKRSVQGTPTAFINGSAANLGQFTLADFKKAIAAAPAASTTN